MKRLDKLLVDLHFASTRTQAQKLIESGLVELCDCGLWQTLNKASLKLPDDAQLRVGEHPDMRYVSRAGLKLEAVIEHLALNIEGKTALDIGQSTGGFTDCLLQHGATKVVGVEVGHSQLVESLRTDKRVICLEGINARYLEEQALQYMPQGFDLIVMDVSFISQKLILPNLPRQLKPQGQLITLIKPQFELGPEAIGKGGIVKDAQGVAKLQQIFTQYIEALGFTVEHYCQSPVKGGDGNTEYLLVATFNG